MGTSPGFRKLLAVALLGLLLAAVWRLAVQPAWRAWQQDGEAVADQRDAIARLRGLAGAREAYESALKSLRRQSRFSDALIRAPSATLAAAELQQRVKSLVEGAGGSLVSAQPTEEQAAGPFTRIGLGVRMIVDIGALQKVLYALETSTPVVVIDEMLVLSRGGRASRRRSQQLSEQLDVRLQLAAYVGTARGETPG